jgi:hypothetical protein
MLRGMVRRVVSRRSLGTLEDAAKSSVSSDGSFVG